MFTITGEDVCPAHAKLTWTAHGCCKNWGHNVPLVQFVYSLCRRTPESKAYSKCLILLSRWTYKVLPMLQNTKTSSLLNFYQWGVLGKQISQLKDSLAKTWLLGWKKLWPKVATTVHVYEDVYVYGLQCKIPKKGMKTWTITRWPVFASLVNLENSVDFWSTLPHISSTTSLMQEVLWTNLQWMETCMLAQL